MANDKQQNEEDNGEGNVVDVINVSGEVMRFEIDGSRYKLKPGETTKINKAYATPRQLQTGRDQVPSTIELLTNKKVLPVTDKRAKGVVAAAANR